MSGKYYAVAILAILILLISSCSRSGAATGGAPRTPFIGGTAGISINFEKDSPPPEVTDDGTFGFNSIIRLKNEGEFSVPKDKVKVNLIGFDPADFSVPSFDQIRDQKPDDDLNKKERDAEGNIVEGTTTYAQFPKDKSDFVPKKFPGNTPFTFRAEVCYNYQTQATTKLCILRDMINIRDNSICRPTGVGTSSRPIYSSSAPVQITNFRQSVVGKDKISFSFDIVLSGNADIFRDKFTGVTPSSGFDQACPKDPKTRRERENNVYVTLTEIPSDPIFTDVKCGGLDGGFAGVVRLINQRRTITCTADLIQDRLDLEKNIGITAEYNVLENKETQILVKHLAQTS